MALMASLRTHALIALIGIAQTVKTMAPPIGNKNEMVWVSSEMVWDGLGAWGGRTTCNASVQYEGEPNTIKYQSRYGAQKYAANPYA